MYLRGNSIGTDDGRRTTTTTDDRRHTLNLSIGHAVCANALLKIPTPAKTNRPKRGPNREWISKVGGCVEGMWNEDDGGVYFGSPADDRCIRGDPPDPQRMQARRAQEGSNTTPLVVGTANGLRRPRCNWIRLISPGLCFLSFAWGEYAGCVRDDGLCGP